MFRWFGSIPAQIYLFRKRKDYPPRSAWVSGLALFLLALTSLFIFFNNNDAKPEQEFAQSRAIQLQDAARVEEEKAPVEKTENSKIERPDPEPVPQIIVEEKSSIKTNESGNPVTVKTKTPEADPSISTTPALDEQWNLKNLARPDYKIEAEKIIFRATPNIKKALYQTTVLSDFNVHMEARIRNNNAAGRFGIIVGYRTMKDSPYEIYYLLSLFRQQEFLLQKYSAFRKELVTRIPVNFDSPGDGFQDIQLEVKCSGPFIELHANQKQVFRWNTGEELVSGQVGVFVSPETEVEVSKFEIDKGTEFSRK